MKKDKATLTNAAQLRRRAEEKLKPTMAEAHPDMGEPDALRLLHELQVHQIELELQNEELRNTRADVDAWLELYTDLYDFAPVGYLTLDRDSVISRANLTAASLLGVERSRLVTSRFGHFVFSETQPAFNAFLKRVFESNVEQTCEVVLLTEAGVSLYVWVEATVPKDSEECRIAVVDITERTHAEEALLESREQVASILDSISDAFFALDKDWRFTYVNNEAESILLKSREQLIGTGIWDQFPEAVGTTFQTEYQRAMLEGIAVEFESYYPPFDSWFQVRAYPYKNGLSVYFRDCTERRAAQDILAHASERNAHIADVLQQTLIPRLIPKQPAGYEIAARYQPAMLEAEVCGDFYDLIDLCDGKLGIVIGDVMGKGLHAAARVAAVRHTIRSYAFLDSGPSHVMTLVNDALFRDIWSEKDMLTAFFAILDTHQDTLAYTNAGHEPPLVRRSDGSVEYLTTGGPMLHGIGEHSYPEDGLSIQTNDILVLVTDGVTEARVIGHPALFGTEGVLRCLSKNTGASAEQIADALLADASSFANGTPRDDVAIVVIRKVDEAAQ